MICYLQKPSGWWNAAAFHQPLLSLSPTKNVNYTQNGSVASSKACSPRRCNHFPYTSAPDSPSGHLQGASGAQVIFKKEKLTFIGRSGVAQRPFQGRWLVPMEPIWFHWDHQAATHRRSAAVSGTNEFQIWRGVGGRKVIRKEAAWEAASILLSERSVSWRLTSRTD